MMAPFILASVRGKIQTQGVVTTRRWEERSIGRKEAQGNFWDDRSVPYLDLGVRQMG